LYRAGKFAKAVGRENRRWTRSEFGESALDTERITLTVRRFPR